MKPTVQHGGVFDAPSLVYTGPELPWVERLLLRGVRHMNVLDAISAPPEVQAIVNDARRAADLYRQQMSDVRHHALTSEWSEASSSQEEQQEVTAPILGISERHTYRIAYQIGVVRTSPLLLDKAAVLAFAASRPGRRRA